MKGYKLHQVFFNGGNYTKSVPETLRFITRRCNDSNPFYFIRISDVDRHIITGQIFRLKKARLYRKHCEHFNLSLKKELIEISSVTDPNVTITYHSNKKSLSELKNYNYYCFSCGFYEYENFIPFLKQSFSSSLFLCDKFSYNNELISKMFSVKTFLQLPNEAYLSIDKYYNHIKDIAQDHTEIISAVGFSSKAIGLRLFKDGINIKFIDLGSAVGLISGNAHRPFARKILKNKMPVRWSQLYGEYANAFDCDPHAWKLLEYDLGFKTIRY